MFNSFAMKSIMPDGSIIGKGWTDVPSLPMLASVGGGGACVPSACGFARARSAGLAFACGRINNIINGST